jgi:hypothetical protein
MGLAEDIIRAVRAGADDAERAVAHLIAEEAQRLAPIGPENDPHRGALRDSIRVERNRYGGWTISANTPYAAKQHEALGYKHPHGGQAKYLEHALTKLGPQLDRAIAATVETHLKRGVNIRGVGGR